MIVASAALLGFAVLLAGLLDRRLLVAAITATIVTDASAVLAVEHGIPDYLLPLSAVAVGAAMWDRVTKASTPRFPDRVPASWVGVTLVAAAALVALTGPFVSDHPVASAEQSVVLVKALLVVAAIVLLVDDSSMLRAALLGMVAGGVVIAALTDLQLLLGWQDRTFGGFASWSTQAIAGAGEVARAAGPFGDDPNSYAQHLATATGAAVGLAVGARRTTRALLWAAAAMMLAAMLATSSRTGLLALAAIAVVALVLWPPTPLRLLAIAGGTAAVALGPFGVRERLGTLGQVGSIGGGADMSLTGRASEAIAAVRLFLERPVTGVGFGTYPPEYLEVARGIGLESRLEPRSAHSLPLEIAAEQGAMGLLVWVALLVFVVWIAFGLRRRLPSEGAAYALAITGFGVTAIFLHDVHPRIMWALVALAIGGARVLDARAGWAVADRPDGPIVAMVIQNYVPALGGAERQVASLAPGLRARGIRPVVVTRALEGRPMRDEIEGVPVVRIPDHGPKPIASLRFVMGARRELRALDPDVIHAFDTLTPSVIALAHRRRHGTPVLVKLLRSGDIGDLAVLKRKRFGERRIRSLITGVDRFVAISTDIADEVRRLGVSDERIACIPNGVDTERFHPVRDGHPDGVPRVIATGRLAPEKRLEEVAARWARVRERHPTAELVLVGDGPARAAIERHAGIRLLGRRDDVPDLLRTADVYVSASNAEGLSNSLLEAMATGLPCVVTDVGGVRDVIVQGVHGIVVEPDALDSLIEQVVLLLDAPERRGPLGRAARERVVTGWSLEATADALDAAYRELAAQRPVRSPLGAEPDGSLVGATGPDDGPVPTVQVTHASTTSTP